jgi:hypothetical protein
MPWPGGFVTAKVQQPGDICGGVAAACIISVKLSGTEIWPGGIAYGADLSVYPGKS